MSEAEQAAWFGESFRKGGITAHESSASDSEVWLTPPELLSALGPFDLDPCACMDPRPWPTARRHLTKADNGLLREWDGRVFCNPPYGGPAVIGPWLRRMASHRKGILLIFARTETAAFQDYVFPFASAILFLRGRLTFYRPDGRRPKTPAGAPSVLIAYGADDARCLQQSGLSGAFVPLSVTG